MKALLFHFTLVEDYMLPHNGVILTEGQLLCKVAWILQSQTGREGVSRLFHKRAVNGTLERCSCPRHKAGARATVGKGISGFPRLLGSVKETGARRGDQLDQHGLRLGLQSGFIRMQSTPRTA